MAGAAAIVLLPCAARAQLDTIEQAIANQTTVIERFAPSETPGTVRIAIEDQRDRLPLEEARQVRFTLRSVTVSGQETLTEAALAPAWAGRIGTEVSVADLYDIADAVEAAYERAGYFSKAVVPVQDFASGRVTLQVYESYLAEVVFESDVPGLRERLAPYIAQLTRMHPIDIAEAQRVLLLMSDLGGVSIDATFVKPDTPTGGGSLVLKAGLDPFMAQAMLDNWGAPGAGPLQATGILVFNDPLRTFGTTTLVAMTVPDQTEELTFVQASQDLPIGRDGLAVGASIAHVASRPGAQVDPVVVDVASTSGGAYLSYPFVRTIDTSLFGRLEIKLRDDAVDVDGLPAVRDRLRWAEASLRLDQALPMGGLSLTGLAGFGIEGLGATDEDDPFASTIGVPPDYRFLCLDLDASHALWTDAALRVQARAQYAFDPLPSAHRMSIGGDTYSRAFEGASASGDSGFAVSAELSQGFDTGVYALAGTQLFAFVDWGAVTTEAKPEYGIPYERQGLGSAGFGARATIDGTVNVELLVAIPWEDELGTTEVGTEFHFKLAALF